MKSIKRMICLILASLMTVSLFSPLSVIAVDAQNYVFSLNSDGKSYSLTSVSENLLFHADIPESYNSKPVTEISRFAFSNNDKIYEITIPDSVTHIDGGAFYGCDSLAQINCASKSFITSDGMLFTADKKTLIYVIDRSVTRLNIPSGTEVLSGHSVADLKKLTSVSIPGTVKALGSHCFAYCTELTEIALPNSVVKIPDYAFSCCTALTGFTVEPTVIAIGSGAFNSCTDLRSVLVPNGTSVADGAFSNCSSLTVFSGNSSSAHSSAVNSAVKTSNVNYTGTSRVTKISINVPAKTVETGKTLTLKVNGIENSQVKDFLVYSSDESVLSYSNGVLNALAFGTADITVVSVDGQFKDSVKITVTDPKAVLVSSHPYLNNADENRSYTVSGKPSKIKVTFSSDTYTEKGEDFIFITDKDGENYGTFSGDQLAGKTLILNGDTVNIRLTSDESVNAYGYRIVSVESADGLTYAQSLTFTQKSVELTVTDEFRSSVNVSPSNAFTGEIIYFSSSDSIASVDKNGVIYAAGVGTATVSAITEYGQVIAQCTVTVKDNAVNGIVYTYDSKGAVVSYCKPYSVSVSIPESVNGKTVYKIAKGAFSFNTKLQTLNIPASVTSIEEGAFGGNSAFTSVSVAVGNNSYASHGNCITTKDGKKLVTVCGGITEFAIPTSVETVNRNAFSHIYDLNQITVGANTKQFIFGAVESCHSLKTFKVSDGNKVFTASNGVLYTDSGKTLYLYPSGLGKDFTVPGTVTSIAAGAFHSCKELETVTIGASVSSIAHEIFCGSVSVKSVTVDSQNKYFSSYCGALYNKSKTELLSVPPCTTGEYTVPNGVKTINRYAFYGCDITKVNLPFSLETIEMQAFLRNRSLSVVVLPPLVKVVEYGAFSDCENISVIGGEYISSIGSYAVDSGTFFCPLGSVTYTAAQDSGITARDICYIADASYGIIAANTAVSSNSNVKMTTAVSRNSSNTDLYSIEFTLNGERFIPSQGFYISLYTKASPGTEIFVSQQNNTVGYSNAQCVSFISDGGAFTVTPAFADKLTPSIRLRSLPAKREYYKNETLNPTGLSMYSIDEYGDIKLITDGFKFNYSFSTYGTAEVKVSYGSYSTEFDVKVIAKPLTGKIVLSGTPTVGSVITATVSELSDTDIPYTLTWYVNGTQITGNNTAKYTVTANDIGKTLKVKVTAINGFTGSFESSEFKLAENTITSDKYSFDKISATVGKVPIKTKVSEFVSNTDQKAHVKVTKNGKELSKDSYISTGAVISLVYGNVTTVSYTVAVTGDINGDGNITITDFVNLKTTLLGTEQKDAYKRKASDINGDGNITITDFVQLKTHLLGGKQVQPR